MTDITVILFQKYHFVIEPNYCDEMSRKTSMKNLFRVQK